MRTELRAEASPLPADRSPSVAAWRGVTNQMLFLLCLMYLIFYIDRVNISTAAPLIKHDLALSNTALGFAFSAFAYPYALFQLIGGWFGDRFGPRLILAVSGVVVSAATMLTGAVGGLASLFLVRLVLGFGEGAAFPTATRAMAAWMPAERWGFAQGITHSASRIGNALTPPLIAVLIGLVSWRGSFVVVGAVSLIWMVVWVLFYRDDPRRHPRVTEGELALLDSRRNPAATAPRVPWLRLARWVLPVTAVDFCYGWTLWVFLSWIPSFFFHKFHLDLKSSALFSSGVFLSGVIGDTLGGVTSDRILKRTGNLRMARCRVIACGMFGGVAFMIPVVLGHSLAIVAVSLSLAFFCVELVVAPIWAVPMDIAPQHAGTASGLMNSGSALAAIVSPPVFGAILDATNNNWHLAFLTSIVFLILGVGLSFTMHPDRKFVDEPEAELPQATLPEARQVSDK
jgi:sugar phosphate permease